MIITQCGCGESYRASEDHVGGWIRCRKCGQAVQVVQRSIPPPPASQQSSTIRADSTVSKSEHQRSRFKKYGATIGFVGIVALAYGIGKRQGPPDTPQSGFSKAVTQPSASSVGSPPLTVETPDSRKSFTDLLPVRVPSKAQTELACEPDSRPQNGEELVDAQRGGYSRLTVENGTGRDAVVALFNHAKQKVIREVYVRNGERSRILSLPAGYYSLRFALGGSYSKEGGFCDLAGASEFDRTIEFKEIYDADGVRYSTDEITLHKVVNGNAPAHSIDPSLVFGHSAGRRK